MNLEVEEETLEVKREQVVAAQYTVDEDSPSERVIGYQMLWYKLKKFVSVFEKCYHWYVGHEVRKEIAVEDLDRAEHSILYYVQKSRMLSDERKVNYKKLFPQVTNDLIRVGGRLSKSALTEDEAHPIVVPNCHVAKTMVWDAHLEVGHGGIERVLYCVRKKYWLLGGRSVISSVLWSCLKRVE